MSSNIKEVVALFDATKVEGTRICNYEVLNKELKDILNQQLLSDYDKVLLLKHIGEFMANILDPVVVKLLKSPVLKENSHERDHLQFFIAQTSSIILTSIHFLTPRNKDIVLQFTLICIPFIIKFYLIFYENSWYSNNVEKTCIENVMNATLKAVQHSNLKSLLDSSHKSAYTKTVQLFTYCLTRNEWKHHLAIIIAFEDFIARSGRVRLTDSFSMILPTALIFIDDFQSNHVVNGLKIINKVFSEVPAAEIRMNGWDYVVCDALTKKLYHRDAFMLDYCLPCLLAALKVTERDPKKADKARNLTKYDDILQILISNLSMCTDKNIIRVHWKHFHFFIAIMGITTVRHLKDLMQLFEYHLDFGNVKHLSFIFQSIEELIRVSWIRFKNHTATLLKYLLKLALKLELNNCQEDVYFYGIRKCILLLHQCDPIVVEETFSKLNNLTEWNEKRLRQLIDISSMGRCNT